MKVTKAGQNRYAFELGAGEPEVIVIEGTDQPGYAGSTLSVAAEGPNWKVTGMADGMPESFTQLDELLITLGASVGT